jgi:hypothetical protein
MPEVGSPLAESDEFKLNLSFQWFYSRIMYTIKLNIKMHSNNATQSLIPKTHSNLATQSPIPMNTPTR